MQETERPEFVIIKVKLTITIEWKRMLRLRYNWISHLDYVPKLELICNF